MECDARAKYIWKGDKHLILLAIGINDTRGIDSPDNIEVSAEEYQKNMRQIIKIAKKHTKDVVIISLTPVDESITNPFENTYFTNSRVEEYNEVLKKLCEEEKLPFIDVYHEIKDKTELLEDGLHPNSEGYEMMYSIIKDFLVENKFIE